MANRRRRRGFTESRKAWAVRLVRDSGKTAWPSPASSISPNGRCASGFREAEQKARHTGAGQLRAPRLGAVAAESQDTADGARHPKVVAASSARNTREVRVHAGGEGELRRQVLCRVLQVSQQGLYASQRRPESTRRVVGRPLSLDIAASHTASCCRYASALMYVELRSQPLHEPQMGRLVHARAG